MIVVAAWACFIFIAFVTLSSLPMRPQLTSIETSMTVFVERFGACGLLGCLFRWGVGILIIAGCELT
jgi:hypothetical protein